MIVKKKTLKFQKWRYCFEVFSFFRNIRSRSFPNSQVADIAQIAKLSPLFKANVLEFGNFTHFYGFYSSYKSQLDMSFKKSESGGSRDSKMTSFLMFEDFHTIASIFIDFTVKKTKLKQKRPFLAMKNFFCRKFGFSVKNAF